MQDVRRAIRDQVLGMVGGSGDRRPERPRLDQGLFGPRSVAWKVHGDVTSMMIGGVSALLLQMLHPGALAGVWDHSDFRRDMSGRLRRTARFVSGTTYGSREQALELIATVRRVHKRVVGHLPDGTPYSAQDPDLLTWVHVAEVTAFLAGYVRYRDPLLSRADRDRYVAEMSVIALELGAERVPMTEREAQAYLRAMRPRLRADDRTRSAAKALLSQSVPHPALGPFLGVTMQAGVDLLPGWAIRMHGMRLPPLGRPAVRIGALGIGSVVRWAMAAPARA